MPRHFKPLAALFALTLAACATPEAPPPAALQAPPPEPAAQPEIATGWTAKDPVRATEFMIAAANPQAAKAGFDMLKRGGAAIDAAIAAQAVLTLVEPQSSGIGGGAFLLYFDDETRRLTSWDGRETAPAAATPDRFLNDAGDPRGFYDAVVGGMSVGVPGVLRMLEAVHAREGRLAWAELFEPAIKLAEGGFAVSPRLHQMLAAEEHLPKMAAASAYFYGEDGKAPPVGTVLRNPELAATLRAIAEGGADAFYEGPLARAIVAAVNGAERNPGDLALSDLAGYQAKERPPVCISYRAQLVCGMGPPSSGGIAVGQILGMLDTVSPVLVNNPLSVRTAHFLTQAERLAFADRNRYVADSDFVDVPVSGLLDKGYLRKRAQMIRADSLIPNPRPGTPNGLSRQTAALGDGDALELPSTSQVSVVDKYGDALSMTTSIENAFGSRIFVKGFLLNNQLTDFSFSPKDEEGRPVANRVEPGKRPRSSMAPTVVLGQTARPVLLTGSPGGPRIIGYTARSVMAAVDWNMDPQEAASLPHVQSRGGPTELEAGTPAEVLAGGLRERGHTIRVTDMTSGLHIIAMPEDGPILGGADPRREGVALGE
ncbi:gamma-glutamyltransferase [Caenispirillum salinarum]|uniref:gamma-glutamyltransferase n=1 Tax=Caenispirillum salinarum TaxID=859058 RepID=UPI00384B175F